MGDTVKKCRKNQYGKKVLTKYDVCCIIMKCRIILQQIPMKTLNTFGGRAMFEKVKTLLVEELRVDPEVVTPEAELANDLGVNSLELADLILLCEEKFNVTIDDDDLHTFITVNDVVNYLNEKAPA